MGIEQLGKVANVTLKKASSKMSAKILSDTTKIKALNKISVKEIKPSLLTKEEVIKMSEKQLETFKRTLRPKICESLYLNFDFKKQKLIEEYLKIGEKDIVKLIQKAETPEELSKILAELDIGEWAKGLKLIANTLTKSCKVRPLTLELEQMINQAKMHRAKLILAREKALHVASQKPQVIAIENILKEQYGCKFVSLKDNEFIAKQILKAYEIAQKNVAPLPKNIIVSKNMVLEGENLFNGTILLSSNPMSLGKGYCSTGADYHSALHEILHSSHPNMTSYFFKKIPKEMIDLKNNLSMYSKMSPTHETFVELNTKRMIEGLTPKEQQLFEYLNFFA